MITYIIIGIGLIAACYGGYKFGYEQGVDDAFQLIKDWDDICQQIQNALRDFDNNE